ncbi:hypothetical protein [Alienimonas chondri]|uniref:Transposase n=1 Tax=Alienimonas chondri TaxID=2681879 RepID=A0ABX1VFZ4_9PLAN|nr:hypothetical protein [Alienimonas chondri]NNJ26951.1 hypothetical protein [Alienimonas chondri]
MKALPQLGDGETPALVALVYLHRFSQSADLLAAVRATLVATITRRTCSALIRPSSDLPPELKPDSAALDHPLPSREELNRW